jgi:hypothetical protein
MDIVDSTEVIGAIMLDAQIAAIRTKAVLDIGFAGDCIECGEPMPRLILGVCCPCRDKLGLP